MFLESLLSESFPSLGVTVHLPSLGCPPTLRWPLALCGGSSASNLVLLLWVLTSIAQRSEWCVFFWELSMTLYIFQRHTVCLVDRVDLICLYSRWEGFGSSSLVTLPLGFNCGFISPSTRGSFVHWGLLLRLPWRTRVCPCEGQAWRRCSCLGRRGSGSTRYSDGLPARAAGNTVP